MVVIAAGTDAVSGGLAAPPTRSTGGIGGLVPVDVWVPGSPPSARSACCTAILLALGRRPRAPRRARERVTAAAGRRAGRCSPRPASLDLVAGVRRRGLRPLPYLLGAAGVGLPGRRRAARALAGHPARHRRRRRRSASAPPGWPPTGCPACSCSSPSGWPSRCRWRSRPGRARPAGSVAAGSGASYALLLGAVAVIVPAGDVFTFLFGWETLTLAFYLLAGFDRRRPGRPAAAGGSPLAFGKASGAALLAGLLLLPPPGPALSGLPDSPPCRRAALRADRLRPALARLRGQGRAGAAPGLDAARLRGRTRRRPGR